MRVLVYPHELAIGGSQINAIDLAGAIRELGHEAIVYGQPGPLVDYVTEEKELRYVAAHGLRYRPAPTRIAQLARLARRERIDVIHAYEWPPCLDALLGAQLLGGVPVVCTVLSMGFTPLVPTTVPLLMGTHELAADVAAKWDGSVGVMEPPIDTDLDHPTRSLAAGTAFRREVGVEDDEVLVVSVSRLSVDLKLDALTDVIDATGLLAPAHRLRLVLVGDGDAAPQLARRAALVNDRAGREVVTLAGPRLDPRAAYAAADVVTGMGSSALRAMAHAKPVVVQGERGFAATFTPDSEPQFAWAGFYGLGPGGSAAATVAAELEPLVRDAARRAELGAYGRAVVESRYSLAAAARAAIETYEHALATPPARRAVWAQAAVTAARALALEADLHRPTGKHARRTTRAARLAHAAG